MGHLTDSERSELNDLCDIVDDLLGFDGKPGISSHVIDYDIDSRNDIVVWPIKRLIQLKDKVKAFSGDYIPAE